jgi:hypothetical protein
MVITFNPDVTFWHRDFFHGIRWQSPDNIPFFSYNPFNQFVPGVERRSVIFKGKIVTSWVAAGWTEEERPIESTD